MHILVIGGTRFSGRFCVERALSRGHRLTLVHRGESLEDGGLPEVEHIVGDRDDPAVLAAVRGREFDAVIDFAALYPAALRALLHTVGDIGHYTVVSSISAYADPGSPGLTEDAAVAEPADDSVDELTVDTYGPLKVACEQVVLTAAKHRGIGAHIVRPGLIIGPRDPTGRFTWWPVRLAAGGTTLAPLPPDQPVQGIDARDLAAFLLDGAETMRTGVHNAVGVPTPLVHLISLCQDHADEPAEVRWADPQWLEDHDVTPWMGLPLWLGTDPEWAGFNQVDGTAARAAGLTHRPLADTVRDVLAWARGQGLGPYDLGAGLGRDEEEALLEALDR